MRSRSKSQPVDPRPVMMRGDTAFEEKWIECDFELVFKQVTELGLASMKETYEFVYRKAYIAGKTRRELNSPTSES